MDMILITKFISKTLVIFINIDKFDQYDGDDEPEQCDNDETQLDVILMIHNQEIMMAMMN